MEEVGLKKHALVSSMIPALFLVMLVVALAGPTWAAPTEDAKKAYNSGLEAAKAGKTDSAIVYYESAVKLSPDYLDAHINVGAIYYQKGQLDLAATHLKAAVALDSTSADAYKNLGLVYVQDSKFDDATAAINRLNGLDPKKASAVWAAMGQAKKKKGDADGATQAYQQAIKSDPTDSKSYYNLGNIQKDGSQFADAIASYRKAIAQNPKFIEAYYNLAISSHQLDMDHCVPDYDAFLKVAAGSPKWKSKVTEVQGIVKQIKDYLATKGGQ